MTYVVYTFSEKITVRNCKNEDELWQKLAAGSIKKEHVWKIEAQTN